MPTAPTNPTADIRPDRNNYEVPGTHEATEQPEDESVIAVFKAMYARIATSKTGDLVITFIVPKSDKLAAIKVSDHPSSILEVLVCKAETDYSSDVQKALQDMGIGLNAAPEL